jgi:hypothetical protein
MGIHIFPALVLQGYETGETSEVLRTFSGEFGRLSVMAKGLRGPRGRFAGLLQPLVEAELTISLRDGASMGTLREASLVNAHDALRGDLDRLALGAVIADVAVSCCEEGQPAEELFEETRAALEQLEAGKKEELTTGAAHRLIRILALGGYEPDLGEDVTRPWPRDAAKPRMFWLDVERGVVHLSGPQPTGDVRWPLRLAPGVTQVPLPPSGVRALHANRRTAGGGVAALPAMRGEEAIQLIEALVRLSEYHLGHELRSVRFWRGVRGKDKG